MDSTMSTLFSSGLGITSNPKSEQIKIRATKQDKALLEACCEVTGKTQYEVVMEGINKVYAENKK